MLHRGRGKVSRTVLTSHLGHPASCARRHSTLPPESASSTETSDIDQLGEAGRKLRSPFGPKARESAGRLACHDDAMGPMHGLERHPSDDAAAYAVRTSRVLNRIECGLRRAIRHVRHKNHQLEFAVLAIGRLVGQDRGKQPDIRDAPGECTECVQGRSEMMDASHTLSAEGGLIPDRAAVCGGPDCGTSRLRSSATGTMKSATAAAEPLEEPPGVCPVLCGFRVGPGRA